MKPSSVMVTCVFLLALGCQTTTIPIHSSSISDSTSEKIEDTQYVGESEKLGIVFSKEELDSLQLNYLPDTLKSFGLESKSFGLNSREELLINNEFKLIKYTYEIFGDELSYVNYELMSTECPGLLYDEEVEFDFDDYKSFFEYKGKKLLVRDFTPVNSGVLNWSMDYVVGIDNGEFLVGIYKSCEGCSEFEIMNIIIF